MTVSIEQLHSGPAVTGQLFKFEAPETAMVVVTNQNLDAVVYSCELLALRRNFSGSNDDYVPLKPNLVFDNDNNYQVVPTGSYAVKVTTSADIVVVVHK